MVAQSFARARKGGLCNFFCLTDVKKKETFFFIFFYYQSYIPIQGHQKSLSYGFHSNLYDIMPLSANNSFDRCNRYLMKEK
jgi:hypothetical protein